MGWPPLCLSLTALILLLYALPPSSSSPTPVLTRGSKLSMEGRDAAVLVSSDGTFSCGFYQVGDNSFTFSIWFTVANFAANGSLRSPSPAEIVWSANRDRPVNGHRSRVSLEGSNQLLVLIDGYDDSVVWSAASTSSVGGQEQPITTAVAETATLLDSGNLVVRDAGGSIMWQSFHFPTDTILPGQPITKNTRLKSSARTSSLSSGSYALYFDNDNVLRLMYDGPDISSIYWPNPDFKPWDNGRSSYNSSRYAMLSRAGRFISSDRFNINASDHELPINVVQRRLTLDPDGNLRLYSRRKDNSSNEKGWYVAWQAIIDVCKIHGQCGRNGICTYGLKPRCWCPPGYRKANQATWKDGCKPIFITPSGSNKNNYFCNTNNRGNSAYQFVKVGHADFYGSDIAVLWPRSIDACKSICEQDCNCQAFVYRPIEGMCYPKAALFNGYTSPEFPSSLFIKLPKNISVTISSTTYLVNPNLTAPGESLFCSSNATITPNIGAGGSRSTSKIKWAYGYGFVGAFFLVEVLFIAVGSWFLYGKGEPNNFMVHSLEPAGEAGGYHYNHVISSHFRMFTYHEIKRATNDFKHLLGKGGSGEVYKGVLDDKRVAAVKRLANAEKGSQGGEDFRAELSVIGRIYHMNVVRMWGFCMQSSRRILVYEYIENGSLDRLLFQPLSDDYVNIISSSKSDLDSDPTSSLASSPNLVCQQNILSWSKRFGIALGTARGLAYLHHECLEWVIHCDIKPENILLDANYQPKIADFGLVKLTQRDSPGSRLSKVRGTKGYMAPEWTSNVPITTKVDVYSYGIILLELITGTRISNGEVIYPNSSPCHHHIAGNQLELRNLVKFLQESLVNAKNEKLKEERAIFLEYFVDPKLHGDFNGRQAKVMLEIAIICVDEDRNKRPTMESVVQMLLNCCEDKF